jgi:uncharacterized protein (DUF1499 family)
MTRPSPVFAAGAHVLTQRQSLFAILGFSLAIVCALAAGGAALAHRLAWLNYRSALLLLRWDVWAALGAAGLSLIGCVHARLRGDRRGLVLAVLGLTIAALTFLLPWYAWYKGRDLPSIHDISTDLDDPPRFVAVLPLRKDAANSVEFDATTAALQRKAYPQIAPALLDVPPPAAYRRALAAARALRWDIVAAAPAEMRIEATDATALMGFKDDIVIRIAANGRGSRVDVRSVSRVGHGDLGTNARRVAAFLKRLAAPVE